jgi:tryptophan halogenase
MKYGWMWKIPVQGRYGCGYVFDNRYVTDEEIKKELEEYLQQEIVSPRMFSFSAGCFEKTWIKNCIAIGLSSGFTEPLEATSIWTSIASLKHFNLLKDGIIYKKQESIDTYNQMIKNLNVDTRNFIHFHYLSKKNDSKFWSEFKQNNPSPEFIGNLKDMCKKTDLKEFDIDYLHMIDKNTHDYLKTFDVRSWQTIAKGIGLL